MCCSLTRCEWLYRQLDAKNGRLIKEANRISATYLIGVLNNNKLEEAKVSTFVMAYMCVRASWDPPYNLDDLAWSQWEALYRFSTADWWGKLVDKFNLRHLVIGSHGYGAILWAGAFLASTRASITMWSKSILQ